MSEGGLTFNRRAVRPTQCLRDGWQLIKDDYWLFLGITFVGSILAGVAFGVVRGPAMCGIHLTFIRREAGQRISFDLLFKGFDYFVQSLIATLLMTLPAMLIGVPAYLLVMGGVFASLGTLAAQPQNDAPDPTAPMIFAALTVAVGLGVMLLAFLLSVLFFFVYPLIVDRGLSGIEAIKLSARAGLANFSGVLGVLLLIVLLSVVGLLACYVGIVFMYPVLYSMIAVAYRQVFPAEGSVLFEPPPPNWPPVLEPVPKPEQIGIQSVQDSPITATKSPEESRIQQNPVHE